LKFLLGEMSFGQSNAQRQMAVSETVGKFFEFVSQ
jgi:hypothetical protein